MGGVGQPNRNQVIAPTPMGTPPAFAVQRQTTPVVPQQGHPQQHQIAHEQTTIITFSAVKNVFAIHPPPATKSSQELDALQRANPKKPPYLSMDQLKNPIIRKFLSSVLPNETKKLMNLLANVFRLLKNKLAEETLEDVIDYWSNPTGNPIKENNHDIIKSLILALEKAGFCQRTDEESKHKIQNPTKELSEKKFILTEQFRAILPPQIAEDGYYHAQTDFCKYIDKPKVFLYFCNSDVRQFVRGKPTTDTRLFKSEIKAQQESRFFVIGESPRPLIRHCSVTRNFISKIEALLEEALEHSVRSSICKRLMHELPQIITSPDKIREKILSIVMEDFGQDARNRLNSDHIQKINDAIENCQQAIQGAFSSLEKICDLYNQEFSEEDFMVGSSAYHSKEKTPDNLDLQTKYTRELEFERQRARAFLIKTGKYKLDENNAQLIKVAP